jgi:acetoin utilization protein AcuA
MQDKDIEFISVLPQQSIMYPFHPGLSCFREPDEQHEYLQDSLLNQPVQISLAIHNGKVIGYANLVPPEQDERWGTLPYVVMMGALEVAPAYRQQKVAHRILQHLFSHATTIEHQIVLALEYYWHWDIKTNGLDVYEYKRMLKALLSSAGMEEVYTDDPDICSHSANFAMARIGRNISSQQMQQFFYLANPRIW